MRKQLQKELKQTRFVHAPLPIHYEDTREVRCEKKPFVKTRLLDTMETLDRWTADTIHFAARDANGLTFEKRENVATVELSDEYVYGETVNSIKFTSPTFLNHKSRWTGGGIQCIPRAYFTVDHEDWTEYNRISVWIRPEMPGFRHVCLRMQFHNEGEHPAPDRFDRIGHHNINLINHEWNHIQVEIPYIHRENVTGISFEIVTSLPTTGTAGTIYLIAHSHGDKDAYDEYVYIESTNKFEKLGSTDVDLSGYVKITDLIPITNSEIDTMVSGATS